MCGRRIAASESQIYRRPRRAVRDLPASAGSGAKFAGACDGRIENHPRPAPSASEFTSGCTERLGNLPAPARGSVSAARREFPHRHAGICSETRMTAARRRNPRATHPAPQTPARNGPRTAACGRFRQARLRPRTGDRAGHRTCSEAAPRAPDRPDPQRDAKIRSQTRTPATRREWPQPDAALQIDFGRVSRSILADFDPPEHLEKTSRRQL